MKTLQRFFQIARAVGGHFLWWGLVWLHVLKPALSPAQRLSRVLEGLGTTFIKLGQGLSLRRDILPDDYVEALQSLQDQVHPFPSELARREVEAALGGASTSCSGSSTANHWLLHPSPRCIRPCCPTGAG